ncbi:hypothetical protein GBA52_004813 [Prunus armeniaca]|nr:hypothetical protein GBA52_004813 [Prunus armeniaca]
MCSVCLLLEKPWQNEKEFHQLIYFRKRDLLNISPTLTEAAGAIIDVRGRSKLGYINGKISAPNVDDPKYKDWLSKDQLVMSWILNSTEPQIAEIFSFSESAFHLWESIKEMYGHQNNAARVFQLQKDIAGMSHEGKSRLSI